VLNQKDKAEKDAVREKKRAKKNLAGGGVRPGVNEEGLHVCVTCGRTDSPEWRKGPLGPKTLCNVSPSMLGIRAWSRTLGMLGMSALSGREWMVWWYL
jgi:hypothetical protein